MLLLDATPLQSEHRLRGVGHYLRHLVAALEDVADPEAQLTYLVSTLGLEHVRDQLPPERTVRVWRPHQPAQVYWLYNEVALRLALARFRPRVWFAPDFNGLPANPYGSTVAVLHDLTFLKITAEPGPRGLSERLSDWRWRVYHEKLRRADRIVAISEAVRTDAVELLSLESDRIVVVPHGLDHDRFVLSRGRGTYADHPAYFVHVGGRNDNKNQTRLLEAFARVARSCPDVRLYFAGPWRAQDTQWLEAEKERLGLGPNVLHLGYVAIEDLPSLYGNARAFVFPSLEEGFGLPVLEAMASGAPVITSDRSSLPEVAGDAALLVDPRDAEALGAAMTRVLEDETLQESLREKGLRRSERFTWRETARRMLDILLSEES